MWCVGCAGTHATIVASGRPSRPIARSGAAPPPEPRRPRRRAKSPTRASTIEGGKIPGPAPSIIGGSGSEKRRPGRHNRRQGDAASEANRSRARRSRGPLCPPAAAGRGDAGRAASPQWPRPPRGQPVREPTRYALWKVAAEALGRNSRRAGSTHNDTWRPIWPE